MENSQDQSTRQKLFEAAVQVFARKGYTQATVREICAAAGANVAAVNYYFGGKEKLYAEVLEAVFSDAHFDARAIGDPETPPEQRLENYVRAFLYSCYTSEEYGPETGASLGAIYLMEMANPSEALDEVVESYIRIEAELLRGILLELLGPDAPEDLRWSCGGFIVAQVLAGITLRPIISRLHPDSPPVQERLEETVALITAFSLGGIENLRKSLQTGITETSHE
jgi:AcrR family transcriptional regulator